MAAQDLKSDFPKGANGTSTCPYCDRFYVIGDDHARYCQARKVAKLEEQRVQRRLVAMRLRELRQAIRAKTRSPVSVLGSPRKIKWFDARARDKFIGIFFAARNRPIELVYLDVRYWQAVACGWNPASPLWTVQRNKETGELEKHAVDESEHWRWWTRRVSAIARAALVDDSRGIGIKPRSKMSNSR